MNALRRSTVMPVGGALDHERGDAAAVAVALRHPGHDDEQVGDDAVGGPELDAVEDVLGAVGGRLGGGGEPGRVGADVGLGEQERADLAAGAAGQVLLLLLVGAEQGQRLRDADRLVRGQQRGDGGGGRADDHQRAVVVQVGQAQAAVLAAGSSCRTRRARRGPATVSSGMRCVALDGAAVDAGLGERRERGAELLAAAGQVGVRRRVRVDQVELEVAEEELLAEAGLGQDRSRGPPPRPGGPPAP